MILTALSTTGTAGHRRSAASSSTSRSVPVPLRHCYAAAASKTHAAMTCFPPGQAAPSPLGRGGILVSSSRRWCTASSHADAAAVWGASAPQQLPATNTAPSEVLARQPISVCAPLLVPAVRKLLAAVAAIAFWSFLTTCLAGGGTSALGSLTIAAPTASAHGIKTAAKSVWTGLAAGVLHTLCGPDHLAALTPLTIGRDRIAASALGALWGFGHSTGQLILGLAMVMLKDRFHNFVPALERWSGVVVACTLVAIGMMGLWEQYLERRVGAGGPDAPTVHAEEEQRAMKLALAGAESGSAQASFKASLATYATGIVYGLQPDALFVVVPALALPTKAAAIAYCSTFVIGTVMAMGGYTLLIGTTSAALMRERPWLQAHLSTVTSGIAIVVGVLIGLAGMGLPVPFFSG